MRGVIILSCIFLVGCPMLGVRQSDLDAWVGIPVEALDTHSMFLGMRLERSYTSDGTIEIRNYVNEGTRTICPALGVCVTRRGACNNIFYVHDGYVMEYRPTGSGGARCFTDDRARPQGRWTAWQ